MTLIQLEYIVAIADSGSFVEAAEKCFVTQPALTTQVKNLEQKLDTVLFDRTRKPIATTPVGKQVVEQAREVLQAARKVPDLVSEYRTEVKGDLSIGIIPTVSPYLIPLFINAFNEAYPDVNVNVSEEITERVIEKLKTGELDVGIIATPVESKGIRFQPLYYEKFHGYVSSSHVNYFKEQLHSKDLKLSELWLLKEGNCFRNQVINICSSTNVSEFHEHFRYESHSIESLKRIVEVKNGMTLIPELAIQDVPPSKKDMVKEIPDINPYREISLALSRQGLKKRLIRGLERSILDNVPERMREKPSGTIVDTSVKV